MKIDLKISYSELKSTYLNIIEFAEKEYWKFDKSATSKSSLNFDLGIDGDDADEFLYKFSQKYNVDFSNFNFQNYFDNEGVGISSLLFLPIFVIYLVLKFLSFVTKSKYDLFFNQFLISNKKPLTIGDLVASALSGRFTERNSINFIVN